jgi:hypothetical protein
MRENPKILSGMQKLVLTAADEAARRGAVDRL